MVGQRVLFVFQREFFVNVTTSFLTSEEELRRGFFCNLWVRGDALYISFIAGNDYGPLYQKGA